MKTYALILALAALAALAVPAMAEHHGDAKHEGMKHEDAKGHDEDAMYDATMAAPVSGTEVHHDGHEAAEEHKGH